ncbi:MAG: AbrB/MazE/SpoVT family DNA-binding domain-containing protein [Candidatus Saccharimonadales bacterium]
MVKISTTLITSGNSVAVRLPKQLLQMSSLGKRVTLEAKNGKIIISKSKNPRDGWDEKIKALSAMAGQPKREFAGMNAAANGGLDDLPWGSPTFEDWQKTHGDKLS